MKFVIQHVPGERTKYVSEMMKTLKNHDVIIIECRGNPMETFQRSLINDSHWHLEDDIILPSDFIDRCQYFEREYSNYFICGFSQKEKQHWFYNASTYLFNQCVFIPKKYSQKLKEFSESRIDRKHPTGFDIEIRDFLVANKLLYYLINPSLVQHRCCKSLLGKRSRFRQSESFQRYYGDIQ